MWIMWTNIYIDIVWISNMVEIVKIRQRTGSSSIEVTIPIAYAKILGLSQGDHLLVELQQNELLVYRRIKDSLVRASRLNPLK